jgi:hypothetical protein
MPVIGDIDSDFYAFAGRGGEADDESSEKFQDAMAASVGDAQDRAPLSIDRSSNLSASYRSSAPARAGRGPEFAPPPGGSKPRSQLVAPSPRQGTSGDFGSTATGAHSSAVPDHAPRLLSPLSRGFLDNFTLEGLSATHIRDLTHQVNQNREAYTFDDQGYSVASVESYVEPLKQTINSLRGRARFDDDEPVGGILSRNKVHLINILYGDAHLRFRRGHLPSPSPSYPPSLGAPERRNWRYMKPERLPRHSAEKAATGMRAYGAVTVHGGPGAWSAYESVRKFAAQPGSAHDQGREVIATVENGDDEVLMYFYKVRQGMKAENYPTAETHLHYGPKGILNEVVVPYNQGLLAPNGSLVHPAIVVLHEMTHVWWSRINITYGVIHTKMGNFTNSEEHAVITGPEAGALEARGIPRRDSHRSNTTYQTIGPNSVTAANPAVEKILQKTVPELRTLTAWLDYYGVDQSRPPARDAGEPGAAQWDRADFAYLAARAIARAEGRET